jgi:hypothetical protein
MICDVSASDTSAELLPPSYRATFKCYHYHTVMIVEYLLRQLRALYIHNHDGLTDAQRP